MRDTKQDTKRARLGPKQAPKRVKLVSTVCARPELVTVSAVPGTAVTWHPPGNQAPHHAMVIGVTDNGRVHIIDWTESKIVTKHVYPANLTKGIAGYKPF